jgi:hypothetical protein
VKHPPSCETLLYITRPTVDHWCIFLVEILTSHTRYPCIVLYSNRRTRFICNACLAHAIVAIHFPGYRKYDHMIDDQTPAHCSTSHADRNKFLAPTVRAGGWVTPLQGVLHAICQFSPLTVTTSLLHLNNSLPPVRESPVSQQSLSTSCI